MDDNGPGCLGIIASLSLFIYLTLTFVYFRRGLVDLGASEIMSWVFAIVWSLVFLAVVAGLPWFVRWSIDEEGLGCLALIGVLLVLSVLAGGHYLMLKNGQPPAWILAPPSPAELIWYNPPLWARITEGIIGAIICMATTMMVVYGRRR